MVTIARIGGLDRAGSFRPSRWISVPSVSMSMTAMSAMPEHVHGDERHAENHPYPVLREPVHVYLLLVENLTFMKVAVVAPHAGRNSNTIK
jgi:hypothetical protein